MSAFIPILESLPAPQRVLWDELSAVPHRFVLYGGTAIALRLGHRQSADFDFFSTAELRADALEREIPLLADAQRLQSSANTLTVAVDRGGPVKLSFFGGLKIGRVAAPDRAGTNGIWVASLLDLAATKMKVVQERAEKRDYLDVFAMLRHGLRLEDCLGAARALYGDAFNPLITLKALAYFGDGDLPSLPAEVRSLLSDQAADVKSIAPIKRVGDTISPSEQ